MLIVRIKADWLVSFCQSWQGKMRQSRLPGSEHAHGHPTTGTSGGASGLHLFSHELLLLFSQPDTWSTRSRSTLPALYLVMEQLARAQNSGNDDTQAIIQQLANTPFDKKWDVLKPTIKLLYIDEDHELLDVIERLRDEFEFHAT